MISKPLKKLKKILKSPKRESKRVLQRKKRSRPFCDSITPRINQTSAKKLRTEKTASFTLRIASQFSRMKRGAFSKV